MKKFYLILMLTAVLACGRNADYDGENGELRISFASDPEHSARVRSEIPDTGDFIIDVTDSKGKVIYSGAYSACPESLPVPTGSYVVKAVSDIFEKPAFSSPQYGDEQCVLVPSGGVADVKLICSQMNAGIRLVVDSGFLTAFPDGVLFLKSSKGKLMYGYSEKRIAYFHPGQVSLILSEGGRDEVLMTRTLQAQEVLSLRVKVASSSSSSDGPSACLSLQIDTTRSWLSDVYVLGESGGGGSESALTVAQARESAGTKDVWVSGYIVGGDLTSSAASFEEPFTSRTNILLGPKSSTSVKSSCLSVQLPAGSLRDALNLVDNPHLLGCKIALKGDIADAYFGIPGMKNVSDHVIY